MINDFNSRTITELTLVANTKMPDVTLITLDQTRQTCYTTQVMKTGIHPEYMTTKVHCNGCDTTFESTSTVPEITVEICSNCHPFYTGKQKLLDTAGRVDKFNARRTKASQLQEKQSKVRNKKTDPDLAEVQDELQADTVETAPEAQDS